jgi:putative lipoic acid-binding regulatory protein
MEPEKIVFPCEYPIKVLARASDDLRAQIDAIFTAEFLAFEASQVTVRQSAQANFVAMTYLMNVQGVEQLKSLHHALMKTEGVVMVL